MLPLPCALFRMAVFAGLPLSVLAQTGPQLSIGPDRIYTVVSGATAGITLHPQFSAQLNSPTGVTISGSGNLLIADSHNNVIRQVSGGTITTVAGQGNVAGPDTRAMVDQLRQPLSMILSALPSTRVETFTSPTWVIVQSAK